MEQEEEQVKEGKQILYKAKRGVAASGLFKKYQYFNVKREKLENKKEKS